MARIATNFFYNIIDETLTVFEKSPNVFIIEQCKDIKQVRDNLSIPLKKRMKELEKIAKKIKTHVEKTFLCKRYINENPNLLLTKYHYFFEQCTFDEKFLKNMLKQGKFIDDGMLLRSIAKETRTPLVCKIFIYANALIISLIPTMEEFIRRDKKMYNLKESDYIIKKIN